MSAHGIVFSLAAGLAAMYLGWMLGERNGDGAVPGWIAGGLVLAGGLLWTAGV